ncbi:MAG TPA: protein-disulfide reductase DsbD domain-containing protein [Alphaproteobacteria bacterium]|nr:protein-disulfide reductase DsbD domain-containing protein [Alphaproteobacteria bacterium]
MRRFKGKTLWRAATRHRRAALGLLFAVAVSAALAPSPLRAQSSGWGGIAETQVRLVSAATATGDAGTVTLGLQFRMHKDWKVYWRSPGDAGYPPVLDWSGSKNLEEAKVSWPAPSRFSVLGFETIGYHEEVVLPITVRLARPREAASLSLAVDYLTCSEICVPASAKLSLDLPAGPASPSEFASTIAGYVARVPGDGSKYGLAIEHVAAGGTLEKPTLEISARAKQPFDKPDVFVEGPKKLRFGPPQVTLGDDGLSAQLSVPVDAVAGAEAKLMGDTVTLTLIDGARAMEKSATAAAGAPLPEAPREAASLSYFFGILGIAVLGGLILNLMPCVLPVLSLKLLSVVASGGRGTKAVRIAFLATAGGVVASFLLLAAAVVAFKEAGYLVGWGVQFQHPAFLIVMVLLLALFACNLWGLFEIRLPGWLADTAARPVDSHSLAGNFATGAFATLLATPCSAPFLGTAVGFALSRGAFEIFAVFAALGAGLALPYLAVAASPHVAKFLPRPGHWMITLKRILALALAATAVWLLTVLAMQTSATAALIVAALAAGFALAFVGLRKSRSRARIAAVAALSLLALLVPSLFPGGGREIPSPRQGLWRGFDLASIPSLVATGHVVLVDVTADWCITCKANEAFVLSDPSIIALLTGDNVVAMRADWTRRDDAIARYLKQFGRYGIPFNAVYGPGAPGGIVLPELLTKGAVRRAILRSGSGPGPGAGSARPADGGRG